MSHFKMMQIINNIIFYMLFPVSSLEQRPDMKCYDDY